MTAIVNNDTISTGKRPRAKATNIATVTIMAARACGEGIHDIEGRSVPKAGRQIQANSGKHVLRAALVPLAGLEPALRKELDFESSASTNSTTGAHLGERRC